MKRGHALSLIVIEIKYVERPGALVKMEFIEDLTLPSFSFCNFFFELPVYQAINHRDSSLHMRALSRIVIETEYVERPGALVKRNL